MTYNEILSLNKNFSPYYDLQNEGKETWKSFMPTTQFYRVLEGTIDVVEQGNISMWLQGTYGTGKSHATGFLKQLLYMDIPGKDDDIVDSLETKYREKLIAFRKNNRVFPVVMYGANKITNQIDFGLQLQSGVKSALKNADIEINTKTEFESYADIIEKEPSNLWDEMFKNELAIREISNQKETIIRKLRNEDQDLFLAIGDAVTRRGMVIPAKDTVEWLKEVTQYLRDNGIATHLMIYWDEFTTVLEANNSNIQNEIQRIAEASSVTGVFLYLISHRTVKQGIQKEDREKLLGRFKDVSYDMSDLTTYHLMHHAVLKKDRKKWELLRDALKSDLADPINAVMELEENISEEDLENLFPIHPYTAHVSAYYARVLGSTERSIFNFLYDRTTGFAFFIANNPKESGLALLTLDYVFDFFEDDFFKQDESSLKSIMQKFQNFKNSIKKTNSDYLCLFKALLALNIAHYKSNAAGTYNTAVVPNQRNLKFAFMGTKYVGLIDEFLEYISAKKIIVKDHEDRYIVEASNIDTSEIESWLMQNKSKYYNVDSVFSKKQTDDLFKPMTENHKRKDVTKNELMDAQSTEHMIKLAIGKRFKNGHELNILFFVAQDVSSLSNINSIIPSILQNVDTSLCVMVLQQLYDDDQMDRYLEFKARAEVAHKNHDDESTKINISKADGLIDKWIKDVKQQSQVTWYVKDVNGVIQSSIVKYSGISRLLDSKIATMIFHQSFDSLPNLDTQTIWNITHAKKIAENILISVDEGDLVERTRSSQAKQALGIFTTSTGNRLINDKLKMTGIDETHPLFRMKIQFANKMKNKDIFNLADELSFLFKPPFGFFHNNVFYAALSFTMRDYLGKLHDATTGEALNEINFVEMIHNVFKVNVEGLSFNKKNLEVRIGSGSEKKLVDSIQNEFGFDNCSSIVSVRYKLLDWFKQNLNMPLWIVNYSTDIDYPVKEALDVISNNVLNTDAQHNILTPSEYKAMKMIIDEVSGKLVKQLLTIDDGVRMKLWGLFISQIGDEYELRYDESDYDSLMDYLQYRMQVDQIYWREEKIKEVLAYWQIEKLNAMVEEKQSDFMYQIEAVPEDDVEDMQQKFIERIESYEGDLMAKLVDFISKRKEYLSIFAEFIEELYDENVH